ncbi:YfdX family protein [Methylobacterium variabile]|jgi:YfdX protein|uniref:YfdX family protein n=1 Tax=Methylobacterium variabile TaxID=298794 RepID=UPI000A76D7A2|nr:YfdX family protein [Methylobacterium variabile]
MHLARIAIFDADPAQAKSYIAKAQAALAKAKTDDAVFTKAEADLRTPADMAVAKDASKGTPKAATADAASADKPATAQPPSKPQIAWIPVDAQLTLGEDFTATPEKASAVTEANKSLAKGDQKGAIEKLKLAHVGVSFIMAALPLDKTAADVSQAASLIGQGKYYEANAVLKTAEDGMRFDVVDAVGTPQKASPQPAGKTAQPGAAATDGKSTK